METDFGDDFNLFPPALKKGTVEKLIIDQMAGTFKITGKLNVPVDNKSKKQLLNEGLKP